MVRVAGTLLIAVALAGPLEAQDADVQRPELAPGDTIHVVESCNTLARIAREYFGDASAWEDIFEANRHKLDDPDDIRVGQELIIPLGEEPAPEEEDDELAVVRDVHVHHADEAEPEAAPAEDAGARRHARRRNQPFEAISSETYQGERTVFYYQELDYRPEPELVAAEEVSWSEVGEGAHAAAPWLTTGGQHDEHLGAVSGFATDRRHHHVDRLTAHPHDLLRVVTELHADVAAGDQLLAYRVEPVSRSTLVSAGRVDDEDGAEAPVQIRPTGILEVERVEEAGVVARVAREFRPIRIFDGVASYRDGASEPGAHPTSVDPDEALEGRLVGFEEDRQLVQRGDRGYIDLGSEDGVQTGDVFVALGGEGEGWSARRVARLQVIRVDEESSAVRVDELHAPLRDAGLPVLRTRRMP